MMGGHYRSDSRAVVDEAVTYAEGLKLSGEGKEVWVFHVDETTLSNLPYYAKHGFGVEPYNWTTFGEYVKEASAPALPESLRLFKRLQSLGIKPVMLTGRREAKREATTKNLARAGYTGYKKLLLKPDDAMVHSVEFKSGERKKLENAGYVIVRGRPVAGPTRRAGGRSHIQAARSHVLHQLATSPCALHYPWRMEQAAANKRNNVISVPNKMTYL